MKTPINNNLNNDNHDDNEDNQRREVTRSDVFEAEARAARAQEEAIILRERLEAMELLLSETRTKLAETNTVLAARDERLAEVNQQSKALGESVTGLESRFENLRLLQGQVCFAIILIHNYNNNNNS